MVKIPVAAFQNLVVSLPDREEVINTAYPSLIPVILFNPYLYTVKSFHVYHLFI